MDARSAQLLGYTHEEVLANFPEHLDALAAELGTDRNDAFAMLVHWYDGYHFHKSGPAMFNPVSVGKCLDVREFKIKGTSAKALEQIKEKRYYERYLGTGDKVILVGAGFSLKTRNITRPKIETA